jgi:hypothetical protein
MTLSVSAVSQGRGLDYGTPAQTGHALACSESLPLLRIGVAGDISIQVCVTGFDILLKTELLFRDAGHSVDQKYELNEHARGPVRRHADRRHGKTLSS